MPSEEWVRVWIYLNFVLGVTRSARPRFDTSTDMGMVLVPVDAEVESVIFRLRATDQDADFPLVFDIAATVTPVIRIENLPCTLYNKICQANVILTRRLTAGRLHDFAIRVRDSKGDSNSMQATISVTNATTQRDKIFPHIPAIIMVPEDAKPGKELDYVLARANQWSGKPVYIELWQPKELFTIRQRQTPTETRGVITLTGELDFEMQSMYTLTLYATDPYTEPKKDTRNIAGLHLVVIVQDVQDVPPIFTHAPPLTKINNTIPPGDVILRVHAEDGDKGVPREVTYGLVSEGNPFTPFFNISESTGEIILTRPLEELTQITHVGAPVVLSVVAEEIRRSPNEPPAQATVVEVGLLLGEPGNSPPYFENDNYVAWMDENPEPGSLVAFNEPYSTKVKDEDIGKAGVFTLKLEDNNGTFEISPAVAEKTANFILSVRDNALIDYEVHKSLRFKIVAQEVGPATNLSASVPVTIFLRDVNDNPPEFQEAEYEVTLSENVTAGSRVVQVHATDKDTGSFGRIQYTQIIGPGSEAFVMNPDTGFITVAMGAKKLLDREVTPQLQLTVQARDEDGRGLRGSVPLIINLLDVNDNAPIFEKNSYDFVMNGDLTNFTVPAIIKATDADAEPPNNEVRYELIHGNYENFFGLNEVTGEIFLRKQITKVRTTRHNPYQALASKFRKTIFPSYKGSEKSNSSNILSTPSTIQNRNARNSHNGTEKIVRRTRQGTARDVLFTLTARAYDLGVPHLSGTAQVNIIQNPLTAARIVMFVVAGENPDPVKTAKTLATITGGHITVNEIRPYVPGSSINGYDTTLPSTDGIKRSIVVARVESPGGTSLVDIDKIRAALAANGVGVIGRDMPSTNPDPRNGGTTINPNNTITSVHSEEVTVYRAENKLLFWLLIILGLLILAAIIALIVCCICPPCPFYMAPRKRRIHSSETLVARSDGRAKRHLHRKYPMMTQDPSWSEKKQAWSADPMRSNWQFNRRNTKQYGLASLPGDVVRILDPKDRYPRKAMSLRGDPQMPVHMNDSLNPLGQQEEHRIYMENIERAREYEAADMDSLRRHECERGSDLGRQPHGPILTRREHHFYREGNAEVMRLVSRGGVEETLATMHRPPEIIIDQVCHRFEGKDILLRRFIEDQKLRTAGKEYHDSLQEDFERQSMESHQRQRELSMQQHQQQQLQQEILLIPEKLESDHRQHLEQLGPDVQRLIIDHATYEKPGRSAMREHQDILTGATLLIPMGKPPENPKETSSVNLQNYTMHDLELATQNVLLTRLLLERDGRAGAVDPASYLETQSLPGQVAIGTQTDQTTATQTEHQSRSRSDNESEEESRIRKKMKFMKRYVNEPKRIRTLWMRSPIEEEERHYSGKRATSRRRMRDIKDGRKISIEPEVLQEISDSLDETGEAPASYRRAPVSSNSQYESREEEEITRREDSSSAEGTKESHKRGTKEKRAEKEEKRKKIAISRSDTASEPSFRILEKEMSSPSKKLSELIARKVASEEDSGDKEGVSHRQQTSEKTKLKEHQEERQSKKTESQSERNIIPEASQSVTKEHPKISGQVVVDKSKQKSKLRKVIPISTASSEWEESVEKSVEKSKTQTKAPDRSKFRLPMGKVVHRKLRRQGKIEKVKEYTREKSIKSETESSTVKLSSSEPGHVISRGKPVGGKNVKEVSRTPIKLITEKFSKLSSGSIHKFKKPEIMERASGSEAEKYSDHMEASASSRRQRKIMKSPKKRKSLKSTTDVGSMELGFSDKQSIESSPDMKANKLTQREQNVADIAFPLMQSGIAQVISTEMNRGQLEEKRRELPLPASKSPIKDDNILDETLNDIHIVRMEERYREESKPFEKLTVDIETPNKTQLDAKRSPKKQSDRNITFIDTTVLSETKNSETEVSCAEKPSETRISFPSGMSLEKETVSVIKSPKTPSPILVVQTIKSAMDGIVEKAKTVVAGAIETVTPTTEDAKDTVGGIFYETMSRVKNQVIKKEKVIEGTGEKMETAGSKPIERTQTSAEDTREALGGEDLVKKTENTGSDILGTVHICTEDAKDSLSTKFERKVSELEKKSEEVKRRIDETKETIGDMLEETKNIDSGAMEIVESIPKDSKDTLRPKAEETISEVKSGITKLIDSGIHQSIGKSDKWKENKDSESTESQTSEMEKYLPTSTETTQIDQKFAVDRSSKPSLTETSSKGKSPVPPRSLSVDKLQIDLLTPKELSPVHQEIQSPPPVDIKATVSSPDLSEAPHHEVRTSTKITVESKPIGDDSEKLECSSLEIASMKSGGSQSSKSIIIVRETSFLNSPRREPPNEEVSDVKSERSEVEDKENTSILMLEKAERDRPTSEPSEKQIPDVNIESLTSKISAKPSDLNLTEGEHETGVSVSKEHPDLPEMSLEMLEDDSDLSSESSTRTTFIAQPYGTPRHRKLIRADHILDNTELLLSSTSLGVPMDDKQEIGMVSTISQVEGEASEYSSEQIKKSRLVEKDPDDTDAHIMKITEVIERKTVKIEIEKEEIEITRKVEESTSKIEGEQIISEDQDGESEEIEPNQVELISKTRQEILLDDGSTFHLLPDISKVATRREEVKTTDAQKIFGTVPRMVKSVPTVHCKKINEIVKQGTSKEEWSKNQDLPEPSIKELSSKNKSSRRRDHPKESKESRMSPIKEKNVHKKYADSPAISKMRITRREELKKVMPLETKSRGTADRLRMSRKSDRCKETQLKDPKIEKPRKSISAMNEKEHSEPKAPTAIRGLLKRGRKIRHKVSKSGILKKSSSSSEVEKDDGVSTVQTCPDSSREMESTSQVEKVTAAMIRETAVELLPTTTSIEMTVSSERIEPRAEPTEKQEISVSETSDSTSDTLGQLTGSSVQSTEEKKHEESPQDTENISSMSEDSQRTPSKFFTDVKSTGVEDDPKLSSPTKSTRHFRADTTEAQSRYMAWYKEMHERREGEDQEEPPKWLRKSTRQRWLKMSPEDRKHLDLKTPEVTPLTRRKIKPLKNVESEQLKAIVRQGRRLRRAECGKIDDPQIQIFAPEKPPSPLLPPPPPKYHRLIQHSEYQFENIPSFYLHPPPVPNPSPQISPRYFDDPTASCSREPRRPDEDMDSGIVLSMPTGGRLRHQQLLEKKSVFDIAYSEAAPSHLRADSTTPPS